MLIDIHCHTAPRSFDSSLYPLDLINRAKEVGIDGICITEHNQFWNAGALAKLGEEQDFLVLPGVEISAAEGHLLIFGLDRYSFGMHRAQSVKNLVDQAGGAIVVAHPYRGLPIWGYTSSNPGYHHTLERACQNPIYRMADAVEVLNGRATREENAFSLELSERLELKRTGGSDAHSQRDVGTYATRFEREIRSLQEFIAELKAGRFEAVEIGQAPPK